MKYVLNKYTILLWILLNGFGFGLTFLSYLQTGFLIDFGFDFEKHWQFGAEPELNTHILAFFTIPMMLIVAGAVLGIAQAFYLKQFGIPLLHWITVTILGFLSLSLLLIPLESADILGSIPGPVEPIMFIVGGGSLAGVGQYLLLKRRGIMVSRWLILWILGLILGILPTFLIFYTLGGLLKIAISWPLEIFINAFVCGGFAAWLSGRKLFKKLILQN